MGAYRDKSTREVSSDQRKWWQRGTASDSSVAYAQAGQPCPKCLVADLDLDSLFRLSCPNCGYVADCGAFT